MTKGVDIQKNKEHNRNMKLICLPNLLLNPVYVYGLSQPLETVADILDEQGKYECALSLRNSATVVKTFSEINLTKTAKLIEN